MMELLPRRTLSGLFSLVIVMSVHAQVPVDPIQAEAIGRSIESRLWDDYQLPYLGIVVVLNGQIVHIAGRGFQDVENEIPFDSEQTMFRAASIAMLPTALLTREVLTTFGISPNDEIQPYLPFIEIPVHQRTPILFEHLLYHTEAIETRNVNTKTLDRDQIVPLREFLRGARIRTFDRPGLMITYGNWAGALLGAAVEMLTGSDFVTAIEQNLLEPAGMTSTTYRQPLPDFFKPRRAIEYRYRWNALNLVPPTYSQMVPSAGMHTTVADMGRLMRILQGDGVIDGRRVLSQETVHASFQIGFRSQARLPGVTVGFFEQEIDDYRLLVRDGDSEGVLSRLIMAPDSGIGLFLVTATDDRAPRETATRLLVDALCESEACDRSEPTGSIAIRTRYRSTAYAGLYSFVQRPRHDISRLPMQLSTLVRIRPAGPDAIFLIPGAKEPFGGLNTPMRFVSLGDELFESEDGRVRIAFRRGPLGEVRYLFSGAGYHGSYEKLRPWERLYFALFGLVVPTLLCIAGTVRRVWQTIQRKPGETDRRIRRQRAGLTVFALSMSVFAMLVFPVITFAGLSPGLPTWVQGLGPVAYATFSLPIIALAAVMITLVFGMRSSATGLRILVPPGLMDRLLLGVAPILFVSLYHWRMLGFWF